MGRRQDKTFNLVALFHVPFALLVQTPDTDNVRLLTPVLAQALVQ